MKSDCGVHLFHQGELSGFAIASLELDRRFEYKRNVARMHDARVLP
jgi:hypothetical protein